MISAEKILASSTDCTLGQEELWRSSVEVGSLSTIFESEGPVQTFFIMLMFLLLKLKGLDEEDYRKFYISYDNMPSIGVTTLSPK